MLENIRGNHNLRRDTASGAIINVSSEAYHAAKLRKKNFREMEDLKEEVFELKNLVTALLQKLDK
jgi:hypothetical protein